MAKVHISQCLCPKRHCIIAIAWEPGAPFPGTDIILNTSEQATSALKTIVEFFIKDHQINPWCGLCHSTMFSYEDGITRFETLEEAEPELKKLQLGNLLAMAAGQITAAN